MSEVRNKKDGRFLVEYEHFKDGLLYCKTCSNYQAETNFYKRKDLKVRNNREYTCKECTKKLKKSQYLYKRKYKLKYLNTLEGYLKSTVQHAKNRKKHSFDIDYEYVLEIYNNQKGKCRYTKQVLTHELGKGKIVTNLSLDRIDSNKGYIKGNVQLVCNVINLMKTNSKEIDFLNLCQLVVNNNNKNYE
jgi:hypothetical protein